MCEAQELDLLAAKSAVACWLGEEGTLADRLRDGAIEKKLFDRWLRRWGLARASPVSTRQKLRKFLVNTARPSIMACDEDGLDLIPQLVREAIAAGGSPLHLLSLISNISL